MDNIENSYKEAGKGLRFLNLLIDLVMIIIFTFLFFFILLFIFTEKVLHPSLLQGLYAITTFLYYAIFEIAFGRTIGKLITGTKVVTDSCEKPSTKKIVLRTLCRFIPLEPFSGFIRPWHDTITLTSVVKIRK